MNDSNIYHHVYPDSKIFRMNDTNCPKSLINIFIESTELTKNIIDTAKYNLLMVNYEFFYHTIKKQLLEYIDIILSKTIIGVKLILNYQRKYKFKCKIYYTKFTTYNKISNKISNKTSNKNFNKISNKTSNKNFNKISNKISNKNFNKVIHLAGKSPYKMTDVVLKTWHNNKSLPHITITCFNRCLTDCNNNLQKDNNQQYIKESSNIKLYTDLVPHNIINELKSNSGCYMCPSVKEGYGHYINEGRYNGAVVITTNAPPMNELINNSNGILIDCIKKPYNRCEFLYEYFVSEKDVLKAMNKYLNLSEKEKIDLGQNAKKQFINDTAFFEKQMKNLYLFFTTTKQITFEDESNNTIDQLHNTPDEFKLNRDTFIQFHKNISPKILKINQHITNYIKTNNISPPILRSYESPNFKKTTKGIATILFLDEAYLPAILTMGYSYKKYNDFKNYNLICLVQDKKQTFNNITYPGVSEESINKILQIYDIVYGIELLTNYNPPKDSSFYKKDNHKNISFYLTKCQIFKLVNYDQILYLDSTSLIQQNIDYMFEKYNDYSYSNNREMYITNSVTIIPPGNIYIYKPSLFYYIKSLYLIQHFDYTFKKKQHIMGIDEIILYYTIYNNWSIDNYIISKTWANKFRFKKFDICTEPYNCSIYQYGTNSPFKQNRYLHQFINWDIMTNELLQKYPEFIKYYKHIKKFRNVNY